MSALYYPIWNASQLVSLGEVACQLSLHCVFLSFAVFAVLGTGLFIRYDPL